MRLASGGTLFLACAAVELSLCASLRADAPLGSGFSFQGQVKQGGSPLNASADFEFTLWDALEDGTMIGGVSAVDNVDVVNGLFTVEVNGAGAFGSNAFNGEARFIEISVRSPSGSGMFTELDPRQPVTGAPYALKVPGVDGHSLDAADGTPTDALFVDNEGRVKINGSVTNRKFGVRGGVSIFDDLGEGVTFTSTSISFAEGDSEDPVYDYSEITDRHRFYTLGSTRMTIQADGNVGIGTTSPGERLSVNGTIESESGGFMFPDGTVQGTAASAGETTHNPLQVALLRWYDANESDAVFDVGNFPFDAAFDGDHIWVTNLTSGSVTKLRASDGDEMPGSPYSAGNAPAGIAFDGANVWIANTLVPGTVTKLRASDGAPQPGSPFSVGNAPRGVAFDGENIWVANVSSDTVTKLRASDGVVLPGSPFSTGDGPQFIAFDGANVWITNQGDGDVTKLRASDGAEQPGSPFDVGNSPVGIAFDGENVWVANNADDTVSKLRASDGVEQPGSPFSVGDGPYGLVFDGTHIWVNNRNDDTVTKLRAGDGVEMPGSPFPVGESPVGGAFDGANVWVVTDADGAVQKL